MTILKALKKIYAALGGTDTLTGTNADVLDKISEVAGSLVVNLSESGALDKTWKEIRDAFVSGAVCVAVDDENNNIHGFYSVSMVYQDTHYNVADSYGNVYSSDSEAGYPTIPATPGAGE